MTEHAPSLAFICSATSDDDGGVYAAALDESPGRLPTLSNASIDDPSFLAVHPDGTLLYVVSRTSGGRIWAVRIDPETGALTPIEKRPCTGDSPCYVSVDSTGRYAFVTTYRGGTVEGFPIHGDGSLGEASDVVSHRGSGADPDRQEAPHPHSIEPGPENRFVYVPDLGTDRIVQYELDRERGRLRSVDDGGLELQAGSGPRHVAFHPNGRFGYVTNELDSTLTAFERDGRSGRLDTIETVGTLPDGFDGENAPADVHVHPSGEWAYASNRGHDSVVRYKINETTGRPHSPVHESTRGPTPRDLAIEPSGAFLFSANQHGGAVTVFAIDRDTGTVESLGESVEVPKPVCVGFLERS